MYCRNLILFLLLIVSTTCLTAQKRANRPRPVKQSVQNTGSLVNCLQRNTVPATSNSRIADTVRPSTSTTPCCTCSNNEGTCGKTQCNPQLSMRNEVLSMDYSTRSSKDTPDFNHPEKIYPFEETLNQEEINKLSMGYQQTPSLRSPVD